MTKSIILRADEHSTLDNLRSRLDKSLHGSKVSLEDSQVLRQSFDQHAGDILDSIRDAVKLGSQLHIQRTFAAHDFDVNLIVRVNDRRSIFQKIIDHFRGR